MDKAVEKNVHLRDSILKTRITRVFSKIMKAFDSRKPHADELTLARRELLKDIEDTLSDLRYARSCFQNAKDPDIIEACVYEIKSAETRYSFLLRKAKLLGEKSSEMPVL